MADSTPTPTTQETPAPTPAPTPSPTEEKPAGADKQKTKQNKPKGQKPKEQKPKEQKQPTPAATKPSGPVPKPIPLGTRNTFGDSYAHELLGKICAQSEPTKWADRVTLKNLYDLDGGKGWIGKTITLCGWIKTTREQGGGRFSFIEVADGSIFTSLQVVANKEIPGYEDLLKHGATGASIALVGRIVASPAQGQPIEMNADKLEILGGADGSKYPLAKKKHTLEYLRSIAHLRPRTNTIGAVARIRNALAFATHKFFQENGFLYVHTPLITGADCEGAGEMFQITTLLKSGIVEELPIVEADKKAEKKRIDFSKDFFTKPTFLTVSGQLNAEIYACAMSSVYTFGPTFRAEDSHTYRHLAEFWMIEPEIAFADLQDNMNYAEAYLKYTLVYVMEHCFEDLTFFEQLYERGLVERLKNVIQEPFGRLTYTKAVEILEEAIKGGHKFEIIPKWGEDLKSEHERYLAEVIFKKPIIVYNYPKGIKAFYMRLNEDGKTVAAMDVLVPNIGEIIGGSQREERVDVLEKRIEEVGLSKETYSWYLDLRRYGTVTHSGFGLGFERLILFSTGMENIRDVIPFPRYPGHAEF